MKKIEIGDWIEGKYQIEASLGEGGMALVYLANDPCLNRRLAIKVLRRGIFDESARLRLEREGRALCALEHKNIVRVYRIGFVDDDLPYLALEFLEGKTLRQLLASEKSLSCARAVSIALQVCAALECAHAAGIIHRDLKPENIFLCGDGDDLVVKVVDFGLCKLAPGADAAITETGMFFGTPCYVDPAVILGGPSTVTTDVYSFGCVLFETLTGRPPFNSSDPCAIYRMHVSSPLPRMKALSRGNRFLPDLEKIIYRCTEKTPEKRYQSFSEIAAQLQSLDPKELDGCFLKADQEGSPGISRGVRLFALQSVVLTVVLVVASIGLVLFGAATECGSAAAAVQVEALLPAEDACRILNHFVSWQLAGGRTAQARAAVEASCNTSSYRRWSLVDRGRLLSAYFETYKRAGKKREMLHVSIRMFSELLDFSKLRDAQELPEFVPICVILERLAQDLLAENLSEKDYGEISGAIESHDMFELHLKNLMWVRVLRTDLLLKQQRVLGKRRLSEVVELCTRTAFNLNAAGFFEKAIPYFQNGITLANRVSMVEEEAFLRLHFGLYCLKAGKLAVARQDCAGFADLVRKYPNPKHQHEYQAILAGCKSSSYEKAIAELSKPDPVLGSAHKTQNGWVWDDGLSVRIMENIGSRR